MKKKCLALLLSLCLVIGLVPLQTQAYRAAPEYLVDYIGMTVNEIADIWGYDYITDDSWDDGSTSLYYSDDRVPGVFFFYTPHGQGIQPGNEQIESVMVMASTDSMIMPGLPCALTWPQLFELDLDGDIYDSDSGYLYGLRIKNDILVSFFWSGSMDPYTDYPLDIAISRLSPEAIEVWGPWEGDDSYWDDDYSDAGDEWYDDSYSDTGDEWYDDNYSDTGDEWYDDNYSDTGDEWYDDNYSDTEDDWYDDEYWDDEGYEDYPQTDITFTDEWEIEYLEAVKACVSMGIINGYPDGSFAPNNTLTRAEAAKLLAYLSLGADGAEQLTSITQVFSDVTQSRGYSWVMGYVAYCAKEGIINGYSNTLFGPADQVTIMQFTKMLLCCLGYGANGEYVGELWRLSVSAGAIDTGISDALSYPFIFYNDAPITRDEAAQLIWYAVNTEKVYYDSYYEDYFGVDSGELTPKSSLAD